MSRGVCPGSTPASDGRGRGRLSLRGIRSIGRIPIAIQARTFGLHRLRARRDGRPVGADSSGQRAQVLCAPTKSTDMDDACEQEVASANEAKQRHDLETAFKHRERAQVRAQVRAHVRAQRMTGRHTVLHWRKQVAGVRRGDLRETVGQLPRIVVSKRFSRL
jgi:Protein of unknown function (DUF3703)